MISRRRPGLILTLRFTASARRVDAHGRDAQGQPSTVSPCADVAGRRPALRHGTVKPFGADLGGVLRRHGEREGQRDLEPAA